jgi:uncharacterized membrane protein
MIFFGSKIKINLAMLVLSSVACLLPIILALAIYNDLPEQMAMQWGLDGNPNWYAHKTVAVFGLPLIFMALNIIVYILFHSDPKRENVSKAMRIFVLWLIPVMSLFIIPAMLFMAMGVNIPIPMITMVFVGAIFIFFGNHMPKNKQNHLVGIRTPWTLGNLENWNKTHRLAGYLWVFGGMAIIAMAFLPLKNLVWLALFFAIVALLVIVPLIYSYSLYKRSKES